MRLSMPANQLSTKTPYEGLELLAGRHAGEAESGPSAKKPCKKPATKKKGAKNATGKSSE
jgi:hypothetical protein